MQIFTIVLLLLNAATYVVCAPLPLGSDVRSSKVGQKSTKTPYKSGLGSGEREMLERANKRAFEMIGGIKRAYATVLKYEEAVAWNSDKKNEKKRDMPKNGMELERIFRVVFGSTSWGNHPARVQGMADVIGALESHFTQASLFKSQDVSIYHLATGGRLKDGVSATTGLGDSDGKVAAPVSIPVFYRGAKIQPKSPGHTKLELEAFEASILIHEAIRGTQKVGDNIVPSNGNRYKVGPQNQPAGPHLRDGTGQNLQSGHEYDWRNDGMIVHDYKTQVLRVEDSWRSPWAWTMLAQLWYWQIHPMEIAGSPATASKGKMKTT